MKNDQVRPSEGASSDKLVARLRYIDKLFEDGEAATYDNGQMDPTVEEPQVLAGPYDLYDIVAEWRGVDSPGLLADAADEIERLRTVAKAAKAMYDRASHAPHGFLAGCRKCQFEKALESAS